MITAKRISKLKPEEVSISKDKFYIVKVPTALKAEAMKVLFTYMSGYPGLMDTCQDFAVLQDMILLCTAFDFRNPVVDILKRFDNSAV